MKRGNAAVNGGQCQTRLEGACGLAGRSGAACSVHCAGCQAQRGGDGRQADPRRASVARRRQRWKPKGETPSAA